jgi:hypothetical protein
METLQAISGKLEKQLNNTMSFSSVVTRVLLRTGVNIRSPKPEQDLDRTIVARARTVLADMGFAV